METFFSRLYVNSPSTLDDLLDLVARTIDGTIDAQTVVSKDVEVDVGVNDAFEPSRVEKDPADFIGYPYSVEVEAKADVALEKYLDHVARVMLSIRDMGASVVASCDWEDKLPGSGKLGDPF